MLEVFGSKTNAKVFTNVVEHTALEQIKEICDNDVFKDSNIRIMPDVHAGKSCVIGFTSTYTDKIIPNIVGVDIGCGMSTIIFKLDTKDIEEVSKTLDSIIREHIPYGTNVNKESFIFHSSVDSICKKMQIDSDRVMKSIGSLGSGNHFIECGLDSNGNFCLTVHTGSRNFGLQVANYHQKKAKELHPECKNGLEYLDGEDAQEYLFDMSIAQDYASLNRDEILARLTYNLVEKFNGYKVVDFIESIHNYIDINNNIIRKGATDASLGKKVIIPISMADGMIIAEGLGNPDYNYSAPHGAGRLFSRGSAKRNFTLDEFKERMKHVYSTCVNESTLDESPMSYKKLEDIVENIQDTVKILEIVKPFYNFKAN